MTPPPQLLVEAGIERRTATRNRAGRADEAAIERVLAGETAAFAHLVERHDDHLRRLLASVVPRNLLDDVLQDAWLLVFRRLSTFRGRARFRTWASRIALREGVRTRTRARLRAERTVELESADVLAIRCSMRDPLDTLSDHDEARALLAQLPPRERAALLLASRGYSYAEVAARLESPMGSVASWIHRARSRLAV